jgi:hypothetical protein
LIGLQIPAKLTETVNKLISSGPPLHFTTLEASPSPNNVDLEKTSERQSKKPRSKRQRESDFSACGLEHTIDGTETEGDDCDSDIGQDNEDQSVTDQSGTSDLIASGFWQADDEAETLFAEADTCSPKIDDSKKNEKSMSLRGSSALPTKQVDSETETEPDDEGEDDDIPLNVLADRKLLKKSNKETSKATQEASALMIDKVLAHESKKIRIRVCAKQFLKETAASFLKKLLERDELSGTIAEVAVKKAIRTWIPASQFPGGLGEKLRYSHLLNGIVIAML